MYAFVLVMTIWYFIVLIASSYLWGSKEPHNVRVGFISVAIDAAIFIWGFYLLLTEG